jgi:hypothetical protein
VILQVIKESVLPSICSCPITATAINNQPIQHNKPHLSPINNMRTEIVASFLALAAPVLASAEETVTVSGLTIHKVGSPIKTTIKSVSFKLNGDDADNLECSSSAEFIWPEVEIFQCGSSNYSFALFEGKGEFATMLYHDIGAAVDLRGLSDVDTKCDNSQGTGPADEICTQEDGTEVTFVIDGPVGNPGPGGDGPGGDSL